MLGSYERSWLMALAAGVGVFLTATYSLAYFVRGFMGDARSPVVDRVYDLTTSERGIVVVLAGLIFWIGLGTSPFIQLMRPSLTALAEHVDSAASGSDQGRQP
jgi:NADH:ubiquinone oxidoreductase subunit 4 (subunit M)